MKKLFVILVPITLIAMAITAIYAYKEYNRRLVAVSKIEADYDLDIRRILNEFLKDEDNAREKYSDKIISLTGTVRNLEKVNQDKSCIIVLGDSNTSEAVRCFMDSDQCTGEVNAGSRMQIKGVCIGFTRDDLLGSDLLLSRCVIEQ